MHITSVFYFILLELFANMCYRLLNALDICVIIIVYFYKYIMSSLVIYIPKSKVGYYNDIYIYIQQNVDNIGLINKINK